MRRFLITDLMFYQFHIYSDFLFLYVSFWQIMCFQKCVQQLYSPPKKKIKEKIKILTPQKRKKCVHFIQVIQLTGVQLFIVQFYIAVSVKSVVMSPLSLILLFQYFKSFLFYSLPMQLKWLIFLMFSTNQLLVLLIFSITFLYTYIYIHFFFTSVLIFIISIILLAVSLSHFSYFLK